MSPRVSRSQLSTFTYFHVCSRGNAKQDVFSDDEDRLRYLFLLEKYSTQYHLECFAYCLMTNHIHLLFLAPSIRILSKTIHALHVAYVMYFNRRHERNGHLFQDRFSSWVIKDISHLITTKEYIENNPVKAGLVEAKEGYLWSSANRDGSRITLSQMPG